MSLLEHPDAQALLDDATVSAAAVVSCRARLLPFLQRYLPRFYREEQRRHATLIIQGRLSGLQRKTTEPIAHQAGQQRRPLQHFVGAGLWDDQAVRGELRRHVGAVLGDDRAVLVIDGHGVPKKGTHSCGVQKQYCGRLGKLENCQQGYFLAYAAPAGQALLDAALYLPETWATDRARRAQTFVPAAVGFREGWRIALEQILNAGRALPHRWVTGDEEFGRSGDLRAQLRYHRERYLLEVPANTAVRDLAAATPLARAATPFASVATWAARQPRRRWRRVAVRDGARGPLAVWVLTALVQTKQDRQPGPRERLVVLRSCERQSRTWYALTNATGPVPRAELARVHGARHRVEELFEEGVGEVGLNHYEVRSWAGWHHHMTLSLVALWFLQTERLRLGGKSAGHDRASSKDDLHPAAARPAAAPAGDQRPRQRGAAA
jgi:SRSO17 transposase